YAALRGSRISSAGMRGRRAASAGHLVDEARDGCEAAIPVELAEIDALDDRRTVDRPERPGKAHGIVVMVDLRNAFQNEAGKLALHASKHGIERGMAVARHDGIAVAAALGPGAGDSGAAAGGIDLVPGGDIGIDSD